MKVPVHQRWYEKHVDGHISVTTEGWSPFVIISGQLIRLSDYNGAKVTFNNGGLRETWLMISQVLGTYSEGCDLFLCIENNWFGRLSQKWNNIVTRTLNWIYPREIRSLESLGFKDGDLLPKWTFTYMVNQLRITH